MAKAIKTMKKFHIFGMLFLLILLIPTQVEAKDTQLDKTLTASISAGKTVDHRSKVLQAYLEGQNSPLGGFASTFVESADENNIDWRLVAAISGVESTFGQAIPQGSYNGWGWGVYADNVIRFSSWQEAIKTISKGLRDNYLNKGAQNVYGIGTMYASSPTWAQRVVKTMDDIDSFEKNFTDVELSLTL